MQKTVIIKESIIMKKSGTMLLLPFVFLGLILTSFIGCGDESIEEVADPCFLNPCSSLANTASDYCIASGTHDFTCECDENYIWNGASNQCISKAAATESCTDLRNCLTGCEFDNAACQQQCYATLSANCLCTVDLGQLPETCIMSCTLPCMLWGIGQACYECGVVCSMNQCSVE